MTDTFTIDAEFKNITPPLTIEEYSGLEQSILDEGCRDALITWEGILIDGHNRYEICKRLQKEFQVINYNFVDRDAVKAWIVQNQLSRRNLTDNMRSYLRGVQYELMKKRVGEHKGNQYAKMERGQNVPIPKTSDTLAIQHSVSEKTIKRDAAYAKAIDTIARNTEAKQQILNNDIRITSKDIVRMAGYEPEKQRAIIDKLTAAEAKSFIDAKRIIKKETVHDVPEIHGKYRVIYADCPWSYGDKLTENYGAADNHYPTMSIEELCDLPIMDLAEDNAVLFFWVTSPILEECFQVIKAWGFKYKASFIWDKVKHNMGHYNSVRHELLLICTRGSCLPDNSKLYDSVVSVERSETHSEKPDEFRAIIDDLYPKGKRIELFARTNARGWESWGNQN